MTATNMLLGIIGILFILFLGCVTPPAQPPVTPPVQPPATSVGWVYYSPLQAYSNPWQVADIDYVKTPTELEQVDAWLSSIAITYAEAVFVPHDEVVCTALNCPRGDYLLILPDTPLSKAELVEEGFAPMDEPFAYVSNVSEAGMFEIHFVNASNETVYYGGCNDYVIQKITNDETTALPGKTCIWEGIPTPLLAGKTTTFTAQTNGNGTFRVKIGYGVGCTPDQPVSQAACTSEHTATTNTFTVSSTVNASTISAVYDLKQCNSNPWQSDANAFILTDDTVAFTMWLSEKGITPKYVSYVPAPEGLAVCLACSCASGEKYRVILSTNDQLAAEELGFTIEGAYTWPEEIPNFAEATWKIITPYQCFANKWNVKKEPVRNIEKDFELLQTWLEDQGVNISHMAFIRGISLSQQCTKVSTDKYGIGVLDQESVDLLSSLGFVTAGAQQTKLFTETSNEEAKQYLFKTKFCQAPPWGEPDLSNGNEAEVVERVMQWLADAGIPSYEKPTIHTVGVSATGSCGTDSGLSVFVTVPAWAETHITPYGFAKPSYAFNPTKTQVWPVVSSGMETGTMIAGGETCEGDACAYT